MDEYQNLGDENEKIQRFNKLEFQLDDVEYIFLKDKTEVKSLSRLNSNYTSDQLRIITKKIHY